MTDRGQTVRNDDTCALEGIKGIGNLLLCLVVKSGSSFVKNQDLRFRSNCPGNHDSLFLAAGNSAAAFRDHGIHAHRHPADIFGNAGRFSSFPGFRQGQLRGSDRDIGEDVTAEQTSVLGYGADLAAQ